MKKENIFSAIFYGIIMLLVLMPGCKIMDEQEFQQQVDTKVSLLTNQPSNINFTTIESTPLLKWNPGNEAEAYHIQISRSSNFTEDVIVDEAGITKNEYKIGAVLLEGEYFWRVRYNPKNAPWSNWSEAWRFKVVIPVPVNPLPVNNQTTSDTTPILKWEAVPLATSYEVQISNRSYNWNNLLFDGKTSTNEIQVTKALMSEGPFYWRVRTLNSDNIGSRWSTTWRFSINVDVPSMPNILNNTTLIDTTPYLDWEDIDSAVGYNIQISTSSYFNSGMVSDENMLTTSEFSVSSPLNNNTKYYWRVRVQNEDNVWFKWSSPWNFTITLPVISNLISPANDEWITDTTPYFDWDDVGAASKYHIQVSATNDFSEVIVDDETLTSSDYQTIDALSNNTTYFWRARIINEDTVASDWSSIRNFTIDLPEVAGPLSPVDNGTTMDTTPLLEWEDVNDVLNYHIQINDSDDFTGDIIIDDDTLTSSQYQISSALENNSTRYWRVRIKNTDGVWGDWSSSWSFTIDMSELSDPVSPTHNETIIDTTPLLNWEEPAGASKYHVQVSSTVDFTGTLIVDNETLTLSQYQLESALSNNSTYYWRVKISNSDNIWGDWSNIWQFEVDLPEVSSPINPVNNGDTSDTTPLFDWGDLPEAASYHIQVNTDSSFSGTAFADDETLVVSQYQLETPLSNNTGYYWRVRFQNTDGVWGDWSTPWMFNIDMPELSDPSAPDNYEVVKDTTPLLDWSDLPETLSYHIQVNTDGSFSSKTAIADDETLIMSQYQITTPLSNNTAYYWRVKYQNIDGVWGDWTSIWRFVTNMPEISKTVEPTNNTNIIDTTPFFNWDDLPEASNYHIQIKNSHNFTETIIVDDDTLTVSQYQIDTILEDEKIYYWRVKFKNSDGVWGNWSSYKRFDIKMPILSSPVDPMDNELIIDKYPLLDWNDISSTSNYHIQINTSNDFTGTLLIDNNTLISSQYLLETELSNEATYYWRIKYCNKDGVWSGWSNVWNFIINGSKIDYFSDYNPNLARSAALTNNGELFLTGYINENNLNDIACVFKLDDEGSVSWLNTIKRTNEGDYIYVIGTSIIKTSDNAVVFTGTTGSLYGSDLIVEKFDNSGSIVWQKKYSGPTAGIGKSIQETKDGGFIIAGRMRSINGINDIWILKLTSDGSIAWQKTYGGENEDMAVSIQETTDGGFIVAGETESFGAGGTDIWILKLNSDGSIAWQKTYGGTKNDNVTCILEKTNGRFIVAGNTYSYGFGIRDIWILELNNDGAVAWQRFYGGSQSDGIKSIQETIDGGLIVAGDTLSFGAGETDIWLLKLSSTGYVLWQKTYGNTDFDNATFLRETEDGNFILGYTDTLSSAFFRVLTLLSNGSNYYYGSPTFVNAGSTNISPGNTSITPINTTATTIDTNFSITKLQ